MQAHSRGLESLSISMSFNLYFQARNKILNDIRQLCTFHISGNLLLYGAVELDYATNCKLFDVVHDYIDETGRL